MKEKKKENWSQEIQPPLEFKKIGRSVWEVSRDNIPLAKFWFRFGEWMLKTESFLEVFDIQLILAEIGSLSKGP